MTVSTSSNRDRASQLRQSLGRLRDETAGLLKVFLSRKPLVRGSVYELRRKCGKPSCACASGGALHCCMAITWTSDGRKRLRSLSPKEQMEMTRLTARHRRFREARTRLGEVHAEMLGLIDQLEVLRRQEP